MGDPAWDLLIPARQTPKTPEPMRACTGATRGPDTNGKLSFPGGLAPAVACTLNTVFHGQIFIVLCRPTPLCG
jgi:hypothetical protein